VWIRQQHRELPLPSGDPFDLDDNTPPYLHHLPARGEFYLTSDSACQTWTRMNWSKSWAQRPEVIPHIPESEPEQFRTTAHQMGGKMLFPGKQRDRKGPSTRNAGATGTSPTGST
jgi:hypothetical protein